MPGASSLDKGTVLRLAAKQGELEGRGETAGGREGVKEESREGVQWITKPQTHHSAACSGRQGQRGSQALWRSALPGSASV